MDEQPARVRARAGRLEHQVRGEHSNVVIGIRVELVKELRV